MVEIAQIDEIDRAILEKLQSDSGLAVAEIALAVGMSPSPCWRRIKRLRDDGVIKGEVMLLDREKLGLSFVVYASIKLSPPSRENIEAFEKLIMELPEVTLCEMITGGVDYLIRIVTTDMHAYDDFLRSKLLALGIVSDIQSRIVLSSIKESSKLPLGLG